MWAAVLSCCAQLLHCTTRAVYMCTPLPARRPHLLSVLAFCRLDADKMFSALWGKLASEILNQNWSRTVIEPTSPGP